MEETTNKPVYSRKELQTLSFAQLAGTVTTTIRHLEEDLKNLPSSMEVLRRIRQIEEAPYDSLDPNVIISFLDRRGYVTNAEPAVKAKEPEKTEVEARPQNPTVVSKENKVTKEPISLNDMDEEVPTASTSLPEYDYSTSPYRVDEKKRVRTDEGQFVCQRCIRAGREDVYITKSTDDTAGLRGMGGHAKGHDEKDMYLFDPSKLGAYIPKGNNPQDVENSVENEQPKIEARQEMITEDTQEAASAIADLLTHRTMETEEHVDPTQANILDGGMIDLIVDRVTEKVMEGINAQFAAFRRSISNYFIVLDTMAPDQKTQLFNEHVDRKYITALVKEIKG